MQAALAPCGDARTCLIHFVGDSLDDERYLVESYRSLACGNIVPVQAYSSRPKSRRKIRPAVTSRKAVEKERPACDEIIIATGINLRDSGVQYWGRLGDGDPGRATTDGLNARPCGRPAGLAPWGVPPSVLLFVPRAGPEQPCTTAPSRRAACATASAMPGVPPNASPQDFVRDATSARTRGSCLCALCGEGPYRRPAVPRSPAGVGTHGVQRPQGRQPVHPLRGAVER